MRWAILGTGAVSRKFCLGLAALGGTASVGAVASRNPDNARAFCASLGVGHAVEDYAAAVADPGTDAVYVATPPDLHEAHARLAFSAGKPALIEKPLAQNAAAAARIAEAAGAAGVFAMEALWTRFQPLTRTIVNRISEGALGDLRGFHGTFLGANVPDPQVSLFKPPSGGALLHRGVYPLSLARQFLGPITHVQAAARPGGTGVDEDIVLIATHENGAISDIRASLRTAGPNHATLWGSRARIEIDGPIWRPEGAYLVPITATAVTAPAPRRLEAFRESRTGQRIAALRAMLRRDRQEKLRAPYLGNGYAHEALALMEAVTTGQTQSDIMPLSQSVEVLQVVDEALGQIARRPDS